MTDSATYYVLDVDGPTPAAMIESGPDLPSAPWNSGKRIEGPVVEPLEYKLDPDYPGHLLPLYEAESVPLVRDDVLVLLRAAGIDNLQLYDAVIHDPVSGRQHTNYKAFNIVGAVSAADMGQSGLMGTSDSEMVDIDFDSLVLDDTRAGGLLMFRLAEAVNAIVVHLSVKRLIEEHGIEGISFLGPGEWSG